MTCLLLSAVPTRAAINNFEYEEGSGTEDIASTEITSGVLALRSLRSS